MKTRALLMALLASASVLNGCAAMRSLESDVSTYSQWPADRKPSTYAFERLPSQQARADEQQALEDAARPAVEGAGFTPAPDRASADVTVQLGARITATDRSPFADPFWWGAGAYGPFPYRHGGRLFMGPGTRFGWGPYMNDSRYLREVAVLIRDRKTGQPLYEASAVNDGLAPMADTALPAMFEAALKDFPLSGANPRRVAVEVKS